MAEQQCWANEFRWELARHSVGEELVVYPTMEKCLGAEGKRIADTDRAQHQEVCRYELFFLLYIYIQCLNRSKAFYIYLKHHR